MRGIVAAAEVRGARPRSGFRKTRRYPCDDSAAQSPNAEYEIGLMAIPALPVLNRKRGNPNWGRPIPRAPALATEFELQVTQLQLTAEMYTSSRELRIWCDRNRNRVYIPEWLLEKWDITVDAIFSGAA